MRKRKIVIGALEGIAAGAIITLLLTPEKEAKKEKKFKEKR